MNPTPSPSGPTSNLKAQAKEAIAALKNENYGEAIALIEPLLEQAIQPSTEAYLRRHLAKAYIGLDNALAAFHQCDYLSQNPDPEVRKWAKKAIDHLRTQYPSIDNSTTPVSTGFTPLSEKEDGRRKKKDGRRKTEEGTEQNLSYVQGTGFANRDATPTEFRIQNSENPPLAPPKRGTGEASQDPKSKIQNPKLPVFPWKNVGRAKRWSPIQLKPTLVHWVNTILVHGWTAIALWIVAKSFLQIGMALGNPIRDQVERLIRFERWYFLEYYPGRVVTIVLVALLILSPWILDLLLRWGHKAKPFSMDDLDRYSSESRPETKKILQQSSRKQNHPIPTLKLLPTQTPVIMSYGLRPRVSRMVVSEGLLRQLEDEELAALVGAELGHIQGWNLALITLVTVSAQFSYGLYQLFAGWADGRSNAFLKWVGATFAAIAYGMFWLVRATGLWLSRSRFEHSDRTAVNLTGHPNALTRALMKLAIATATDIRRQGYTAPVLEKFEWLMPVSYHSAISTGTIFPLQYQSQYSPPTSQRPNAPTPPLSNSSTLLDWDYRNPHRSWLSINSTHPPLGDRLYRLAQFAKQWNLDAELDLPAGSRLPSSPKMNIQVAPFMGFFVGAALTLILWFVGVLADQFNWRAIEWLQYDSQSVFRGLLALSFSFGTILRFNDFFPDIKPSTRRQEDLTEVLNHPDHVPANSQPVQLEGKLLGRRGTGNWLNQDLILQTSTGLVRLHCISILGGVGNLIFDAIRLQPLKGRTVTVTGWLRRGAIPWMDVETISSQRGKSIRAGHPIWSMLLAAATALWGAYMLY